jgi:cobalt-zinc-cadmium efflux system outer membrane protein
MEQPTSQRCSARKAPSARRSLGRAIAMLLGLASVSLTTGAHAQRRVVTEADVLAAVRARDPDVLTSRAAIAASRARESGESVYPNPSLSWEREQLPGDGPLAEREDVFAVTVPIELSGARSARRALAESVTAQTRANHAIIAVSAARGALDVFYEAIAAREHIAIAKAQLERLGEAERVLSRRVAEGSAPGYDLLRLQLEAELARSALEEREGQAASALAELSTLLELPRESIELSGDLELRAGSAPVDTHRSAALLDEGRRAVARAEEAAGLAWLPALQLRAGAKLAAARGQDAVGYLAGVSLELPLFDDKSALGRQATAAGAELEALSTARGRARERLERRARVSLERARLERARFEQATRDRISSLERAADSAYREGRQTIIELLDAQRMRTAIEERALALRLQAKRAELDLRAAGDELAEGQP